MHVTGRDDELVCGDADIAHISRADELRGVVDDANIKHNDDVGAVSRFVLLIQLHTMFRQLFETDVRSESENYSESARRR